MIDVHGQLAFQVAGQFRLNLCFDQVHIDGPGFADAAGSDFELVGERVGELRKI